MIDAGQFNSFYEALNPSSTQSVKVADVLQALRNASTTLKPVSGVQAIGTAAKSGLLHTPGAVSGATPITQRVGSALKGLAQKHNLAGATSQPVMPLPNKLAPKLQPLVEHVGTAEGGMHDLLKIKGSTTPIQVSRHPTLESNLKSTAYDAIHPDTKRMIEESPWVKQHGMSPKAVATMAYSSRMRAVPSKGIPEESLEDAIHRHLVVNNLPAAQGAAPDVATRVAKLAAANYVFFFKDALEKMSVDLSEAQRAEIAPKNFALSAKQSDTGKPAYPIEDKAHAANALARVKQFGNAKEKSEVYKDVAKKYPELAAKSSVPSLKKRASAIGALGSRLKDSGSSTLHAMGEHLKTHGDKYDLAGLGILAAPSAANLLGARKEHKQGRPVDKKELWHSAAELGGLGVLAAPVAAHVIAGH